MADDVRISYSFQVGSVTQPAQIAAPSVEPLVAFATCDRVELGNGTVLLLNRENGRQMTVQMEVATALTYCSLFRTIGEHAKALVTSIPQLHGQLADVTTVLNSVNDAGLMTAAHAICDRLNAAPVRPTELPPTRVCIISCDRPTAVQRLLDSMLQHAQLSAHEAIFLIDDSRNPANLQANQELVASFNRNSAGNPILYLGHRAQSALLAQMATARPQDADSIRYLIERELWESQPSYGLARTLCLLLTVGRRCIVMDDDILCQSVLPPKPSEGISFGGGDQRELDSYDSEKDRLQQAELLKTDPLIGHSRCLGMPLAEALADLTSGPLESSDLHNTNAAMMSSLNSDSPLLITQCGSSGDPGSPGTSLFYHLDQASIDRILATKGGLVGAAASRNFWLGRSRPNIGKMAVMSQATGLDNSRLLPPYFPAFRGEDYLFASMVFYLHPRSATLDYAWSVPHLPISHRGGPLKPPEAAQGGLALLGRFLADQVSQTATGEPAARLDQLAHQLDDLALLSDTGLLMRFRTELARERASQLQLLNAHLQQAEAHKSSEWLSYLQRGVESISTTLQTPASLTDAPDAKSGLDETELLGHTRHALHQFARALRAWPEIRSSAQSIVEHMIITGEFCPTESA